MATIDGALTTEHVVATVPDQTGAPRELRLRLHLPPPGGAHERRAGAGPLPVLLWVHGSGFFGGAHLLAKCGPSARPTRPLRAHAGPRPHQAPPPRGQPPGVLRPGAAAGRGIRDRAGEASRGRRSHFSAGRSFCEAPAT